MLDQHVVLRTADESLAETLSAIYIPFLQPGTSAAECPDVLVEMPAIGASSNQSVVYGNRVWQCESLAQVLYTIDKIITIELQVRRRDLYFVHGAAFSAGATAVLIVGESGAGKSTLCWSLCDAGFRYLSDELAPVMLEEIRVQPFPRAISLKTLAVGSPPLPAESIDAGATKHVPANSLMGGYEMRPLPIEAIVFLLPESRGGTTSLLEVPTAEAAARLYANGLNQLAHENDGLKAATTLASKIRGMAVTKTELSSMTAMITGLLEQG